MEPVRSSRGVPATRRPRASAPWRRIALGLCALGLCALATAALAESSDGIAGRLQTRVDARAPEAIALLEHVVEMNSGTRNPAGVLAVGHVFEDRLRDLAFATEWISGDPYDRAGHLVARLDGHGPTILLIGHLDTVFEPDSPFQRFERLDDGRARGPGTIDMKGGVVVLLTALAALRDEGLLEGMNLRVLLTGDEESPGAPVEANRAPLVELAKEADLAIGFEDGDGDPATAVTSRRGSGSWRLEARGRPAHSSLVHSEAVGAGAIFELARILGQFGELREPHLTLSVGLVLGGTTVDLQAAESRGGAFGKPNVVPEHAVAVGDLRPFSLEQREETQERMRRIVATHLPETEASIAFSDSYPPMAPSPGNDRLLTILDAASRELGHGPVVAAAIGRLGAADISFAAPFVDGALDGLGLMGSGGHTVEETADLSTLRVQAARTALLLHRLQRGALEATGTTGASARVW